MESAGGQFLAVIAASDLKLADIQNFRQTFNRPVTYPQTILVPGRVKAEKPLPKALCGPLLPEIRELAAKNHNGYYATKGGLGSVDAFNLLVVWGYVVSGSSN